MHPILKKLQGGDRRSIGRADEVVEDVLGDPTLFEFVFAGMLHDDPIIRMRAADVDEGYPPIHPKLIILAPYILD